MYIYFFHFNTGGDFYRSRGRRFQKEAHIILHLGEVVRVAEEDSFVHGLMFCVMFWVQMRRICLQCLKILGYVIRPLDGYCGRVVVLVVPWEECHVPISMLALYYEVLKDLPCCVAGVVARREF